MLFSKALLRLISLVLIVTLTACESPGKKAKPTKDKVKEETVAVEGEAAPALVLIPNPYQPGDVPGQAKQEFKRAKVLMEAKKWKEAEGVLQLMTTTFPTLSGPYINLGIVYQNMGKMEDAEKALKFAIETNPLNLDAYTQLGVLYRETGRFKDAETVYIEALKVWPHHLPSNVNLGILYDLYMGRFEEALKYYQLSLQIAGGEDRELKGWIADLTRRMENQ